MSRLKSTIVIAVALCAILVPLSFAAHAQQPTKIPRIGYLSGREAPTSPSSSTDSFRQGLRDLGYTEGKNILIEYHHPEGRLDRVPGIVAELVQRNVDILVLVPLRAIRAAKQATKTIPIVMVATVDPVATGIIDSLAHPGGNITGLTTLSRDLSGKRLELLTEVVPKISRVGVLWEAAAPAAAISFKEYEAAARTLNIQLQCLELEGLNPDLDKAFRAEAKGHTNALIGVRSILVARSLTKRIAELAIKIGCL